MNIVEGLSVGGSAILAHKLRAFLTMLGIIFGVAAVISMVSIGSGAREEALKQIELMGTNTVRVLPLKLEGQDLSEAKRKSPKGLTQEDHDALARICPGRVRSAMLKEREGTLNCGGDRMHVQILGITPEYPAILNHEMDRGRPILPWDDESASRVCVLGWALAQEIPLTEPVGERIRIDRQWFKIIGVLRPKSKAGAVGAAMEVRDLDRLLYMPLQTCLRRFPKAKEEDKDEPMSELSELVFQLSSSKMCAEAEAVILRSFTGRHQGVKDFKVEIPEELLRQSQRTQRMFNMILSCVAGISLVVGGIGIMNIMLATVTERTKEIGIRRSVGATRSDILGQFLIECLVVSAAGGLLGIGLGMSLSRALTYFLKWPTVFSAGTIVLSIGVAGATGVLFGLYPAYKASRLDPIESLRYE